MEAREIMERFAKAVSNILKRFSEAGKETIDLYDVWIESSIPMDIMKEVIEKGMAEIPLEVRELQLKGKTVWRREKYEE